MRDEINNGLMVITGPNGCGKTVLINAIRKGFKDVPCVILDTDATNNLASDEIEKFAYDLKEVSKTIPVIIATLRKDIIDKADRILTICKKD